jgi:excisionase family DNA binding protein
MEPKGAQVDTWFSVKAAAGVLGVHVRTVRRMLRAGMFKRVRQVGAGRRHKRVEIHAGSLEVTP